MNIDPILRTTAAQVVDRLDDQVLATPTGELRNLLTDAAIVIQALLDPELTARSDKLRSFSNLETCMNGTPYCHNASNHEKDECKT